MDKEFVKNLNGLAQTAQSILVTSHLKPDDDSISSVLGMYQWVTANFPDKRIEMYYSASPQERWRYFENFDQIKFIPDIATVIHDFDLVIFLDGNQYSRFTVNPEMILSSRARKVCIDHHASPPDTFDLAYIQLAPSTASLVYDLFFANDKVSPRLAEIFLLGIVGDTGFFRFIYPRDAELFATAGKLVQAANKSIGELEEYYQLYSQETFVILQEFLKNASIERIEGWPPVLVSFISRQFSQQFSQAQIEKACSKYISHYSRTIKDAPWGVVFYPLEDGNVVISLRSRKSDGINVRQVVEGMGIGGGHDLAAGGMFRADSHEMVMPERCMQTFKDWLRSHPS